MQHKQLVVPFVLLALVLCLAHPLARAQVYCTDVEDFTPLDWYDWSANNGVWQMGTPTKGPGSAYSGKQCFGTTLLGKDAGTYPTNTSSRLVTPPITLPYIAPGQRILLTFWHWFRWAGAGFYDPSFGEVQISLKSNPREGDWKTISNPASANSPYNGRSPAWSLACVDLSAYACQQIWIGFRHVGGTYKEAGWYIDDVCINVKTLQDLPLNQTVGFEDFSTADWHGWSADNGIWQVGTPTKGPGSACDESQCFGTMLQGKEAGAYPTDTASRLISPPITLPLIFSTQQHIFLKFCQWFQWAGAGFYNPSFGEVQVSQWTDKGWGTWKTVSPQYSGISSGWSLASVDLSSYAGQRIQIGFWHVGGTYKEAGWYIDDVKVELRAPKVAGQIVFNGLSPDARPQNVTFTFRPKNGSDPFTRTAFVGPDGAFSIVNIPSKAYTLHIKGSKWLAQNVSVDTTGGKDVTNVTASLAPSDANNDNSVDIFDLATLAESFNTTECDPAYNPETDFNGDGSVDIFDLGILASNFNTTGDP